LPVNDGRPEQGVISQASHLVATPPMSSTSHQALPTAPILLANPSKRTLALSAKRVLITDEHYKHSLAIVRHLGKSGVHVSVVTHKRDALVALSKFCRETVLSAGAKVEDYVEATLRAVRQNHYDVVIPVSYPMTLALAKCREQILAHCHLELVDNRTIECAANKVKMAELARKIGVPAPRTLVPVHADEFLNGAPNLTFPVVVKPQKESPGRSRVRYAKNRQELQLLLKANLFSSTEPPLVQEFIPGSGCGFFATYQHGVCKRVFMHRRVREYPASGGVSSCAESFHDPKLEEYGRQMLDALGWHGVAMVEFRRDSRDGDYKLMEINPKFWGSLDLALAAGADFPGDLCRMALGETLPFVDAYQRNLRYQWPLSGSGDLFHLWTRPQSIFKVARDFLDPRVKSNVWMDDPSPNLREVQEIFSQLLRRRKN
jgi:predicted ATP-grasp superfamily ATP-dependent carboligase